MITNSELSPCQGQEAFQMYRRLMLKFSYFLSLCWLFSCWKLVRAPGDTGTNVHVECMDSTRDCRRTVIIYADKMFLAFIESKVSLLGYPFQFAESSEICYEPIVSPGAINICSQLPVAREWPLMATPRKNIFTRVYFNLEQLPIKAGNTDQEVKMSRDMIFSTYNYQLICLY